MSRPSRRFELYPRRSEPTLDPALFANPSAEYRGTPFWCWNDRLDRGRLLRQLDVIQRMGFGGFHVHSRTGLATEYLGETWMNLVALCADEAARRDMRCWLYDEDRWPSGYAGGLTTKEDCFRQRQLLWTTIPYGQNAPRGRSDYTTAVRNEAGRLLARYEVELNSTHRLARYRRLSDDESTPADRITWHAYLEPATPSTWFNGQTAVDVFSRAAIGRFIETTHERYREALAAAQAHSSPLAGEAGWGDERRPALRGESPLAPSPNPSREGRGVAPTPASANKGVRTLFGAVIPGFFTDEPQFTKKSMFAVGDETHDLFMPFAEDFAETYRATFDQDLLDHLPELFWNLPDDALSVARHRYHEHTAERFASAFSDTLGDWCGRHGVALTGHMLGEGSLMSQTRGCGEAMRGLRSFHVPGIDILCDKRELTTAKQAISVARQLGRAGVASELYGVTGWHFDFLGHKAQGDWQAALGVTLRVPHLFWMSMRGEAKRDYPASIGEQSPWFEEYTLIEDHFARVATVMTRGKPIVKVAVIHPIESAWLHWGPKAHNDEAVQRLESSFTQLPEWLLFGGIDFDYLSEAMLARDGATVARTSGTCERPMLRFGAMNYECVVVPPTVTLRTTTLDLLERFADAGGTVLFAGEIARHVDAMPSDHVERLSRRCRAVPFDRDAIVAALASLVDLRITLDDGKPAGSILHQLRADAETRSLFLVNTDRTTARAVRIVVRGDWVALRHDTLTGDIGPITASRDAGQTLIEHTFPPHGHLLLSLSSIPTAPSGPSPLYSGERLGEGSGTSKREIAVERSNPLTLTLSPEYGGEGTDVRQRYSIAPHGPVPISLSEPNVLVLDRAALLPSPSVQPRDPTDILVLDNLIRDDLQLPRRTGRGVQPWADESPAPVLSNVRLRFTFETEVDLDGVDLALENPEDATIHLDGKLVSNVPTGWWVDQAIQRIALPSMKAGAHDLCLTIPFTRRTELEAIHLLGDFGVQVDGASVRIVAPVRQLHWGDWTVQGLPFYGGNVTYHVPIDPAHARMKLAIPSFRNPLLAVDRASRRLGTIAFPPFELEFDGDGASDPIDLTAFGNRANTFGPLHHADRNLKWIGPAAWRTTGGAWQDAYQLRPMGILAAPQVFGTGK